MKVEYYILDPTGNITALVTTAVEPSERVSIANKIMKSEPSVQQVGFVGIDENGMFLNMAGGEFCGNASMSTAALFNRDKPEVRSEVYLTVSGCDSKVKVGITPHKNGTFSGSVSMPKAISATERKLLCDGETVIADVVEFPGITHVIFYDGRDMSFAERNIKQLCSQLDAEAIGIMLYDKENRSMLPLVYVPEAGTLCRESSCLSGTSALILSLSLRAGGAVTENIKEPGGTLIAYCDEHGSITLSGTVKIIKKDTVET